MWFKNNKCLFNEQINCLKQKKVQTFLQEKDETDVRYQNIDIVIDFFIMNITSVEGRSGLSDDIRGDIMIM